MERELGMDIIEWKDVKDPQSEEVDVLGCWNVYEVASMQATEPRFSRNVMDLKLGERFGPAAERTRTDLHRGDRHIVHACTTFREAHSWLRARLAFVFLVAGAACFPRYTLQDLAIDERAHASQ